MPITVDCGEGKCDLCTGRGHTAYLIPQESVPLDEPPFFCGCRCHHDGTGTPCQDPECPAVAPEGAVICARCEAALEERVGPEGHYWWANGPKGKEGSDCLWTDGRSMAPHQPTVATKCGAPVRASSDAQPEPRSCERTAGPCPWPGWQNQPECAANRKR